MIGWSLARVQEGQIGPIALLFSALDGDAGRRVPVAQCCDGRRHSARRGLPLLRRSLPLQDSVVGGSLLFSAGAA